jgi:proteasome lid subunit RPN8/RPN11
MCFLGGNLQKKEIEEIVFLPTETGYNFASININLIPIADRDSIVGSLHSHPNGYLKPSKADAKFFKRFKINIILGNKTAKFFDENAQPLEVEIN